MSHLFLFPTRLGMAGMRYSSQAIQRAMLPEATAPQTRARLEEEGATVARTVPEWVRLAGARIARVLEGEADSLQDVPLDMSGLSVTTRKIYEAARTVRPGEVVSYAELARRAGSPGASRAVGRAMAQNPFPPIVPCHRIVSSTGALCGFSAHGGIETKASLLAREGVTLKTSNHPLLVPGLFHPEFDSAEVVRWLSRRDAILGRFMRSFGPFALEASESRDPYTSLARAIVFQQLSGKAASTIWGRFLALYPDQSMPSPSTLSATTSDSLRAVGLSQSKVRAIHDLAARAADGTVPRIEDILFEPDDEIVSRLSQVRGVGRWSVEMFLLFGLGRPNVMPSTDYGVRKGFQEVFRTRELPLPERIDAQAERWSPYSSVATWYLWRATDKKAGEATTQPSRSDPART